MKRSELKQIIKEEIQKVLKEYNSEDEFAKAKNKELFIHLIHAEDDPEHLVYALFDKDDKIIKSDFEDITSAERWANENGYVATQ